MAQSLTVLLLDDGELDDVQEILEQIGAGFGRVRGGAIAPNTPPPTSLLISTPRRIGAVCEAQSGGGEEPVRIVVVDGDSNTLREKLREIGFDYLVRRPVHPEALRLLLMHCLYTGEERRREPRIPVGLEVSFRTGLLPRRATLADLSTNGCRLLSSYRLESNRIIRIQIPRAVSRPEVLSLSGRIIRIGFDKRLGDEGLYDAAVVFENMTSESRQELEWILEDRARGPATLDSGDLSAPELEVDEPLVEAARSDSRSAKTAEVVPPGRPPAADPRERVSVVPPGDDEPASDGEIRDLRRVGIEVDVRMEQESEEAKSAEGASRGSDRRKTRRGAFEFKVPAFGSQALRVLVGRDLSSRGMRVERYPTLELGDRLHLAIYGDPHEEPFLVWATVTRDDGEEGMALVFDEPHPVVAEQLDKVVASLPSVESLHDDEAAAMGTVVTQILDD